MGGVAPPALQVALDTVLLDQLGLMISQAVAGGADQIEVGTPLLKRYGTRVVTLARSFVPPEVPLYVDVKMIDFPNEELVPVLDAGATAVTAVAWSDDACLSVAHELTQARGADLYVSAMGYDPSLLAERALEIVALGIPNLVAHGAGLSAAAACAAALGQAEVLDGSVGARMSIGGGLGAANVAQVARYKPRTVIVGRSVTRADDVAAEVSLIKARLHEAGSWL